MSFIKRLWKARQGTGLNKFVIGSPDEQGKQTLVNDPDSVTEVGDVISADNLNDLEQRILDGFNDANTDLVNGLATKVPKTTTVNGKALTGNISLTYSDVGAVPNTRTVNNKQLNADITLSASDVGAVPTSRKINGHALTSDVDLLKLVWTNPDLSQQFPATNVSLGASNANAYLLIYYLGYISYEFFMVYRGNGSGPIIKTLIPIGETKFCMVSRDVSISANNTMDFSNATKEYEDGTTTTHNGFIRPYRIYEFNF